MTLKSKDFNNNAGKITQYTAGVSALRVSGIEEVLREKAIPSISGIQNESQALATEAARSAGYNEALNDLFYYKEKYILPIVDAVGNITVAPDFGAINKLLEKGDITEDEANDLKRKR